MQRILITGSSRGLGYEFTKQYLSQGQQVIATCRKPELANNLHLLKDKYPGQLGIIPLDVSQDASIAEALTKVNKLTSTLDILINNAGIGSRKNLQELTFKDLTNVFLTNAAAPLFVARAFLPLLAKSERPMLANITSRLGSITLQKGEMASTGSYDYNASKAALNMLVAMLANELKPQNIIVLAQSPGWARTDMGREEAPNSAEEVVTGMIKLFSRATLEDTGKFYEWTGQELPW